MDIVRGRGVSAAAPHLSGKLTQTTAFHGRIIVSAFRGGTSSTGGVHGLLPGGGDRCLSEIRQGFNHMVFGSPADSLIILRGRGVFVASPYPPGNSPCEPYQYDRRIFVRQLSRSIFISKSPGGWRSTATMIVSAFKKLTSGIGGVCGLGTF